MTRLKTSNGRHPHQIIPSKYSLLGARLAKLACAKKALSRGPKNKLVGLWFITNIYFYLCYQQLWNQGYFHGVTWLFGKPLILWTKIPHPLCWIFWQRLARHAIGRDGLRQNDLDQWYALNWSVVQYFFALKEEDQIPNLKCETNINPLKLFTH